MYVLDVLFLVERLDAVYAQCQHLVLNWALTRYFLSGMKTRFLNDEQIEQVKKAVKLKGWPHNDLRWLIEASCYLEPEKEDQWRDPEFFSSNIFAASISRQTWKRFLNGTPINIHAFDAFSEVLGLDLSALIPKYVERPPCEGACWQELQREPGLVRISAIRGMGKTELVKWIIAKARKDSYSFLTIDFDEGFDSYLNDPLHFLDAFKRVIAEKIDLNISGLDDSIAVFLEKNLLSNIERPLLLILERFDRVFESEEIANELSKLIRSFHSTKPLSYVGGNLWNNLRIVIVHSTESYPTFDINSSPLVGVGKTIYLKDFSFDQVKDFCKKISDRDWSEGDIKRLMSVVGGHPRLLKLAIDYLDNSDGNQNINTIIENLHEQDGPYYGHLREMEWHLDRKPELKSSFTQILWSGKIESKKVGSLNRYWLNRSGLVRETDKFLTVRYDLYRRYFEKYMD